MDIRVLGNTAASVGDQRLDLGPARQRCVLAALLMDANDVVSIDQIVERVWGDRRPQRTREALYSYLSRLRRVLSPAGVTLDRSAGGYLLGVDPEQLDLTRFHRLARDAREAGDGDEALRLFEEALAQWRGDAFADLDTPWLVTVREQLGQERLSVELERNDLALRLGRHTRLLPELSARADAHPSDERLVGQLMLALYRCGRQADALTCYDRIRRLLAEEYGVDPGAPLQKLHQRILTIDPTLDTPPPPEAGQSPKPVTTPRQLPPLPPLFIGRAHELTHLSDGLETATGPSGAALLSIEGTGGIGKTWLAVQWALANAHRFPDGHLFLNLRGYDPSGQPLSARAAVGALLDALGVAPGSIPADVDAQIALYRALLADRRTLVVLDNARDAEQVRPLLPRSAGSVAVVTSRSRLPGLIATEGAHLLTLGLLSRREARDLFVRRLGRQRVDAEPEAVEALVTSCAGLPLALSIVAARAVVQADIPLGDIAVELTDRCHALDVLADDDPFSDLRSVFSWSYDALTPQAAQLFRLLGLYPGPQVTTAAAASLVGVPPPRARLLLDELVRRQLLTMSSPGRYVCHDLLRAYAGYLVDGSERAAATRRLLDHYLHTAHAAALVIEPHRDVISLPRPEKGVTVDAPTDAAHALRWFDTERSVLLAAVRYASDTNHDTHSWQLAWALTTFLSRASRWQDLAVTQEVALAAAQRDGDDLGQAHTHREWGLALNQLGRHQDAITQLHRAADLFRRLGDLPGQAQTFLYLGWVCDAHGRSIEGTRYDERALALFRQAGHKAGEAKALNALGWDRAQNGDHRAAIELCQRALILHDALGNQTGAARTWDSLGYAHHHLGDHREAVACYRRALALYEDNGDRYGEGETLTHLGTTHRAAGDLLAAVAAWRRALSRFGPENHDEVAHLRDLLRHAGP
ncbi:BTAD domain-containing putative transcriptional regulator [Micromonospora sp. DT43]|uniref:AfsR/SARP family transcriptional regulator n=1 Tax=Micromonospora sp. DT43 TaxID=3393440 RepID=UPI003CEE0D4F